jgi:hypothetical protein
VKTENIADYGRSSKLASQGVTGASAVKSTGEAASSEMSSKLASTGVIGISPKTSGSDAGVISASSKAASAGVSGARLVMVIKAASLFMAPDLISALNAKRKLAWRERMAAIVIAFIFSLF